jgi:methylmalonyl-CoA mutase
MNDSLFNDFPPVSSKQWKQKIQFDLKGADYNENLIWKSPESIDVKPFYHNDEIKEPFLKIIGHPQHWNIGQCIYIDDEAVAGRLAADTINRGAEAVYFTSEKPFDIDKLFKELNNSKALYYFDFKFLNSGFCTHSAFAKANIFLLNDIIHHHAQDGNWHQSLKEDFNTLQNCLKHSQTLYIDSSLYQNAGATIVQQLAYALAHANEYFNAFEGQISSKTQVIFKVAVGSNYFFEIAKIRALRSLYSTLAKEYALRENCHIIATPSKRNKTLYDYNVNMLRTTTECMSAVLGGADTVCNLPYDGIYHKSNEFGERISRNQLLILKHESYFDTEKNPAEGTLYIETLTRQLAEKALDIFKEIESGSGFLNQLKEGTIQKKIKESASKEQEDFDKGEKILLGTNKYTNPNDRMKSELELYPFVKTKPRKTLIEPIIEKRLAEKTEQERLGNE